MEAPMTDFFDYDEELERERMEEETKRIKDQADDQMREYYNSHPEEKKKANRIAMIAGGFIIFIILIFVFAYAC